MALVATSLTMPSGCTGVARVDAPTRAALVAPHGSSTAGATRAATPPSARPVWTVHANNAVRADDPALRERAERLVEIVRIESEFLRRRLDPVRPLDAVTLIELDRIVESANRVESLVGETALLRNARDPRDRRALADATTALRAQWTAFQYRLAQEARTG